MGFYFLEGVGHYTWEVPEDVVEATFALWGGSMYASATVCTISDLVAGEVLHFNLGGNQINSGWNGGGASAGAVAGGFFSTGGGGASDLRRGGNTLGDRMLVAGGALGMSTFFSPGPGFGQFGSYPGGGWPGNYWYLTYDIGDGSMHTDYQSPGYVSPEGVPAVDGGPRTVYHEGPAGPSGPNGADSTSHTLITYGLDPPIPEAAVGTPLTVHLGAGGGGWEGGEGGQFYGRQADPIFHPTRHEFRLIDIYNGRPGTSWIHPSISPGPPAARPGAPDTFFAQRLLDGAVFINWTEAVETQQWRVGRIGPRWAP